MVSTIVVSVVSIIIISLLTYKLSTQPKMGDRPDGLEMPEDGQRPDQQDGNGGPQRGRTNESGTEGETSNSESTSNGSNI